MGSLENKIFLFFFNEIYFFKILLNLNKFKFIFDCVIKN